jgi:hypothetical protein
MKNFQWKKLLPHIIAVAVFIVVALVYCKPVLEGKVMAQSDVRSWKAMAQNSFQYRDRHGEFPLWSNGLFSGMPAFQITSVGTNPVSIVYIGNILSLNLPKPVSFFFLACICFYFLSQVLKVNPYIGLFGALAYAYATYNPVIISAGHDTKMQAIAYLPAFIASLLLIYNRRYLWGTALTALFTALLLSANHLQITYYSVIIAVFMSVGMGIRWIKDKDYKHLTKAAGFALVAALLGIMVNAVSLFSTYDYSKRTIRGGSELADNTGQFTKTGLSTGYALSYSMYKTEPLVMMFPPHVRRQQPADGSGRRQIQRHRSIAADAPATWATDTTGRVTFILLGRYRWRWHSRASLCWSHHLPARLTWFRITRRKTQMVDPRRLYIYNNTELG